MSSSAALLVLFALLVTAVALVVRWVGRRVGAAEIAVFSAMTLAFLFPGFFRGRTILPVDHAMLLAPWSHLGAGPRYNANLNDAITQMAPWTKATRMAWKEGCLPLRNRWNGSSMALAANGQSAAFSPFSFLMLPVALAFAFNLMVAAKIFLALTGASLWLRELGLTRGAAAFGAVLFGFNFSMGPWLLFPFSAVMCLLPWALFAIELLRSVAGRRRAFVLLTAVFVAWPLCGHPESAVMSALFISLWLTARYFLGALPDAPRLAMRIGLAAALALGLTAFLTIPEALVIRASNRVRFAEAFLHALPTSLLPHLPYFPGGFLTTLFPRAFGDAIDSPMIPGGAGAFPELTLGYFGVVGAALAALVFRRGSRRSRVELAFIAPLVIGLLAATASWPVYDLVLHLPVLRLMFVLRYLSLFAFAGAAIAAFEADRLARDIASDRRAAISPAVSSAAIAAIGTWAYLHWTPVHAAAGGLPSQRRALVITLLAATAVLAICAVGAFVTRPHPRIARLLPVMLAAAAAAELLVQGGRLFRFDDPARLFPETPLVAFLRSRPGPFRVVGSGAVLFPGTNVFAGVEDIRVHDPVEREDYVAFLDRAAGYPPDAYFKMIRDFGSPALDLLNVRYAVGEPGERFAAPKWRSVYDGSDGVVFENADFLPRIFAASRADVANRHGPDGFEVSDYRERTNSIVFRSRTGSPVPAVVSVVQDGGWSAEDDTRRPIPTSKASGLLLALTLPAGDHEIRLIYSPPGFVAGAVLSGATAAVLVALAALAALALVKARRRPRPPRSRATGSG